MIQFLKYAQALAANEVKLPRGVHSVKGPIGAGAAPMRFPKGVAHEKVGQAQARLYDLFSDSVGDMSDEVEGATGWISGDPNDLTNNSKKSRKLPKEVVSLLTTGNKKEYFRGE